MTHRLIIIERLRDGRHLAGVEDTTDIHDATNGLSDANAVCNELLDGKKVQRRIIAAGISIRVTLTPDRCVGQSRRKRETQR